MKLGESVRNAIVAVVIGIFMMMPGVCGATLAVIFGIYDRLIRDISQPRKYLREDAWFLLTIIVVGLIGAFICLKFLAFLLDDYEVPLMFFFATAVAIQLPDLWKQAGGGGRPTSYNVLALAVGFILMIVVLYAYVTSGGWEAPSNPIILIAAGVIYGACLLSPGVSGSTVLLALGLFTVVVDGLADLDLMAIAPLVAGAAIGVLLFAKVIDHFITHNRSSTYFAIIGLTAGSVVTVVIQAILKMEEGDSILLCILAIVAGIALGVVTHLFTSKYTVPQATERCPRLRRTRIRITPTAAMAANAIWTAFPGLFILNLETNRMASTAMHTSNSTVVQKPSTYLEMSHRNGKTGTTAETGNPVNTFTSDLADCTLK